jgi:site-specific recombinase XerD
MTEHTIDIEQLVDQFLRTREAMGCTSDTLSTYRKGLVRFVRVTGVREIHELTREVVEEYLGSLLKRMKLVSAHRHYRVLRTFLGWLVKTGKLSSDPLEGFRMRTPKTLPRVPEDEEVRRLLAACDTSFEGRRNRTMIALLADSGLRKEELRRLRVGDVDLGMGLVRVTCGKGQRDRVGFFGETTASLLRSWLELHPDRRPQAFLFVTREGVQLGPHAIGRILGRISKRAGLPRRIGPHALRHYAATSILRRTGDVELVRRTLGHSSIAMSLRYAELTQADIARKFQRASPMDHLWTQRTRVL